MSAPAPAGRRNESLSRCDRPLRDVLVIVLYAAALVVPSMFTRDLWNPDEPRYMEVAREMALDGTLKAHLVLHLNGEVYSEKPPLFFWLTRGLLALGFGLNSGRVLAGLAAAGTAAMVYAHARRRLSGPFPLAAALFLLTTLVYSSHIRTGVIDPVLAFFVAAAIFLGFGAMQTTRRVTRLRWLGAYAAAGLAVLTKGHVGFFVPLLVLMAYGLWDRKRTHGGGWIHLPGALLMLLFVAAWLVPAGFAAGWDYVRTLTIGQVAKRVGENASHGAPFYYFAMQYPLLLFPWFLLFIPAVMSAARGWRRERDPEALFLVIWFFGVFLFFSAIPGKRVGYLLPLVPAVALLMARYLAQGARDGWPWPALHRALMRSTLSLCAAVGVLLAAGASAVIVFPGAAARMVPKYADAVYDLSAAASPALLAAVILPLVFGAALCLWHLQGRGVNGPLRPFALIIGLALLICLHADVFLMPHGNRFKSGRLFCEAARPFVEKADELYFYFQDHSGLYNLYLERTSIPVLETKGDLRRALESQRRVAVITKEEFHDEEEDLPLDGYHILAAQRVGHRRMVLVANWRPDAAPE